MATLHLTQVPIEGAVSLSFDAQPSGTSKTLSSAARHGAFENGSAKLIPGTRQPWVRQAENMEPSNPSRLQLAAGCQDRVHLSAPLNHH